MVNCITPQKTWNHEIHGTAKVECILQVFVCLWVVCDEVCGCFLKPHLVNKVLPQAVKTSGLHHCFYSFLHYFKMGSGFLWEIIRYGLSQNSAFLRDGLSQNIYKHVPKTLAQGAQQHIVIYTSPKATMLWTTCFDDISSCHRQCCLYCWCWFLKRFGIVCV